MGRYRVRWEGRDNQPGQPSDTRTPLGIARLVRPQPLCDALTGNMATPFMESLSHKGTFRGYRDSVEQSRTACQTNVHMSLPVAVGFRQANAQRLTDIPAHQAGTAHLWGRLHWQQRSLSRLPATEGSGLRGAADVQKVPRTENADPGRFPRRGRSGKMSQPDSHTLPSSILAAMSESSREPAGGQLCTRGKTSPRAIISASAAASSPSRWRTACGWPKCPASRT